MTPLAIEEVCLLAAAPKGIQRLRALILDLAVRGKLVSHGASEPGAASSNLQIPDGPFALPTGWGWVRLREITAKIGAGSTPLGGKKAYVVQGIKFLRSQNVWNQGLRLEDVALISEKTHQKMSGTHIAPGDLLFNITGASIGRCAIVPDDFDAGNVSQHVTIVRPSLPDVRNYLHIALTSELVQRMVMSEQVGVSREGLSIAKLSQFQIPLPPLAEQHRIVAKVDELMALCDQLEAEQQGAEAAHAQLVQALLESLIQSADADEFRVNWQRMAEHFHTIFTTGGSVDALKQALLLVAVAGKLVPQDQKDEPAPHFLARNGIGSEQHVLTGWAIVRLGAFGEVLGGATPSKANSEFWAGNIPWVSPKDMKRPVIADAEDHISAAALNESPLREVPPNSILMVVRGMILAHSFPVAITANTVTINQDMKALVPPAEAASYLLLYLQASKAAMVALVDRSSHGTCKLVSEKLWNYQVMLPPLEEQHRIVAKVTELLALCDQLKAGIAQARQQHEQLAAALVEQAVA